MPQKFFDVLRTTVTMIHPSSMTSYLEAWKPKYAPIHEAEGVMYDVDTEKEQEQDEIQSPKKSLQFSFGLKVMFFSGVILLLFFIWIIVVLTSKQQHTVWASCGDTAEEARARGCTFDVMSFAWQTPECYDAALVEEFIGWETWDFYDWEDDSISVPFHTIMRGEQSAWVSWQYHLVHCTFMWRQMHRAYERGWIDSHLDKYNHTVHCQDVLLHPLRLNYSEIGAGAPLRFPTCRRV